MKMFGIGFRIARLPNTECSVTVNGDRLEGRDILGFRITNVSGRENLEYGIKEFSDSFLDGANYLRKNETTRIIEISYNITVDTRKDYRSALDALKYKLSPKNAKFVFDDDPDFYYIGNFEKIEADPAVSMVGSDCYSGSGVITIRCSDPHRYSVKEATFEVNEDGIIRYNNGGNCPSHPIFEATFSSDCGYIAFTDEDENILQFGTVDEVDTEYKESSDLIVDSMGENPSKWVLNNGYPVGQQGMVQTGSFKNTNRHNEACLEVNGYGSGEAWHGPCYMKDIPDDGAGVVGAVNCLYGWTHFFVVNTNRDVGIAQFFMTDEDGTNIAAITFFKTGTADYNGYYKLIVAGKTLVQRDCTFDSASLYTSWANGWSYMQKFQDEITFKIGNVVCESFKDASLKDVKVRKIGFFLGAYGTNEPMGNNGVRKIRFTKHNVDAWVDIPNKFSQGDKLVIDTKTGSVLLNNIQELGLGVLGNDWETFLLKQGVHDINVIQSEWANPPDVVMRYREVFK